MPADKETVKFVLADASFVVCASAIERVGALSLSVIVRVADAVALLVLTALEIETVTVSSTSSVVSSVIVHSKGLCRLPSCNSERTTRGGIIRASGGRTIGCCIIKCDYFC